MDDRTYGDGYTSWKKWEDSQFGAASDMERKYFDLEVLSRHPKGSNVKLLEIGFGNGALLAYARSKGADICGVEVNQSLLVRAKERGIAVYHSVSDIDPSKKFDVIVALDVLEHLMPDAIVGLLTEIRARLEPDGVFLARFPNGDSPFGLIHQNGDVTHVTAIGKEKLRYFASATGYKIEYLGDPIYISAPHLGGFIKGRIRKLLRAVLVFFLRCSVYNEVTPLGPNYLAVMRPL